MHKHEKISLIGLFLIIAGVFMPWHAFTEYFSIPAPGGGQIGHKISIAASGYDLSVGRIILAIAVMTAVLVFVPKSKDILHRILTAQMFLLALTAVLFIMGGIVPIFSKITRYIPHIGLLSVFAGCIITFIGLRKGIRD